MARGELRSSGRATTTAALLALLGLAKAWAMATTTAAAATSIDDNGSGSSSGDDNSSGSGGLPPSVLVVGSLNVDVIIPVYRLPGRGETTMARSPAASTAVGGKGANQAVAAARLCAGTGRCASRFVCRFGNDSFAQELQRELAGSGVDVSGCGRSLGQPSGQGIVLLEEDGTASSVVLGGSNTDWPEDLHLTHLMRGVGLVLLQREVPERVNIAVAKAAAAAGVPVMQDAGGEQRPLPVELLRLLSFVAPNELELSHLAGGLPTNTNEQALAAARVLTQRGARSVLVTLSGRGAMLVGSDGVVLRQEALPVPGGVVVDATAAGDAFRAAFAVALVEGNTPSQCLRFAAAAGAVAVSRMGAVPSLPTRDEVERLLLLTGASEGQEAAAVGGSGGTEGKRLGSPEQGYCSGGSGGGSATADMGEACSTPVPADGATRASPAGSIPAIVDPACPYKFSSRLNSMRARRDLAGKSDGGDDVLGWIARQGRVVGLDYVDFNYPQHLSSLTLRQVQRALTSAGLQAGAVATRFGPDYHLGAFSNPDDAIRGRAVATALEACRWASDLGARDLVVWPQYDGYDYNFQVDYQAAWHRTVRSFQQVSDGCPPGMRVSLEWKATDETTRYSIVPSTGAALLLAREVGRPNFGLTLDIGHCLMAGENAAQSVAMVGREGKLFGMQLNDAHVKLGAEDGLAFGSVVSAAALEVVRWLQMVNYDGHIYFDTFPRKEDPVREAEYNIRRFKALWSRARRLETAGIDDLAASHDAMGVLELLEADSEVAAGGGAAAA